MRALRRWILLCRPHFLLGGALLYGLGAFAAGVTDVTAYIVGQVAVTASQLTAHLVNEYADVEADRLVVNRTLFSGGSGVLVSGDVDRQSALTAAIGSTAISLLASIAIGISHPIAGLVAATTVFVSWGYSMPPIRLLGTGWGELATSIVVVVAVPTIAAEIQGSLTPGLWWAMAALLPIHLAMMLAFELPDLESDRQAGKRVLAVRLERRATEALIVVLLLLGLVIAAAAAFLHHPSMGWILLGAPMAVLTVTAMSRQRHGLLTAGAVGALITSAAGAIAATMA